MPARSTVHIDTFLSDFAAGVMEENAGLYIAGTAAPITRVGSMSNKYPIFDRNFFVQDAAVPVEDGEEIPEIDFTLSSVPYVCTEYGIATRMTYREMGETGPGTVNPAVIERAKIQQITNAILLRHELAFAATYFRTGVWGTDKTGGAAGVPQWDDFTSSDPEAAIDAAQETLDKNGGMTGNVLIIGREVFKWLKRHPRIKPKPGLAGGQVTPESLAQLFGVERIIVAGAKKATNQQGATAAYDYAFGKSALLVRAAANGSQPSEPSAMRIFSWTGSAGPGSDRTVIVERFDVPLKRKTKFQVRMNWAHVVQASTLGYFWSGIVSA